MRLRAVEKPVSQIDLREELLQAESSAPSLSAPLLSDRDLMAVFADFIQLEVANGDATEDTVLVYYHEIRLYIEWCRSMQIEPLTAKRIDLLRYRDALKTRGMVVGTRAKKLSIVRRFYASALREGLIRTNPGENVRGGKDLTPPEEKIKALTLGALRALIQIIPSAQPIDRRNRVIVALMAIHGLRRIEVHRLQHESVVQDGDSASIAVWGKGNKVRRVYLRPDVWQILCEWVDTKATLGLPLQGALFVAMDNSSRGKRISRRSLNNIVDKYLGESGLKRVGISCHALRHTSATLALAGGATVEHLRDNLGHADLATTSKYVQAVERRKHNPANFIDVEFEAERSRARNDSD